MPSQVILASQVITVRTVLTTSFTKILTVPFPHMLISRVHISNTNAANQKCSICYCAPQEQPGISNSVLWNFVIANNEYSEFGDGEILDRDWIIYGSSPNANMINVFLSAYGLFEPAQL